jgi:hypothetical protein
MSYILKKNSDTQLVYILWSMNFPELMIMTPEYCYTLYIYWSLSVLAFPSTNVAKNKNFILNLEIIPTCFKYRRNGVLYLLSR